MNLVFHEEAHVYTLDDQPVPSVTTILKGGRKPFYAKGSAERGHDVHTLSALLDLGEIAVEDAPERYQGYLRAWVAFKTEMGFVPELIEVAGVSELDGVGFYAGTIDRIGVSRSKTRYLIDLKSGAKEAGHAAQVEAYLAMDGDDDGKPWTAAGAFPGLVYVKADGTYKTWFPDAAERMNAKVVFRKAFAEYKERGAPAAKPVQAKAPVNADEAQDVTLEVWWTRERLWMQN